MAFTVSGMGMFGGYPMDLAAISASTYVWLGLRRVPLGEFPEDNRY